MGKVVVVEYVTLDGVFEEPRWSFPYFNEELQQWQWENLQEADALLLGRRTYEGFKEAWPKMNEGFFGERMNTLPKYVATRTLTEPEWGATLLAGDAVEAVAALRESEPGTLLINGSGDLLNQLTAHRLVDEYRIMVFPVVAGTGRRLWADGTTVDLTLTRSHITTSGVAVLTYVPA